MMIYYIIEVKENWPKAPWRFECSFAKLKEAKKYMEKRKEFYPYAKHRVVKLKREKIYW